MAEILREIVQILRKRNPIRRRLWDSLYVHVGLSNSGDKSNLFDFSFMYGAQ